MGSLGDETVAALAGVVGLCRTTQEDADALQRRDEAALALLDINDDEAMKALTPWIRCLEAWAGPQGSQQPDGPWPTMTQLSTAILPSPNSDLPARRNTPPPTETPLPALKALTIILFRVMLMGSEVQGSPHRAPAAAAWAACRTYLLMLSLPGAAAYGVLQPAVLGLVLTNMRAWCRGSPVYRPGGGAASAAASVAVEGVEAVARTEAGGKKKGHQKRRRGGEAGAGSDSESDQEGGRGGGRGKRRTAAVRDDGERVSSCRDVQACLRLLKACLACVPLASHQDLTVKLSEVLVAVAVVATVEGPAALVELASSTMVKLVTGPSGYNETTRGAALQALMPVLLMSTGKPDVPPRNKDCLKAHDVAFEMAKEIAIALRNASTERRDHGGSIRSIPGGSNDPEAEQNAGSTSTPATTSASPGGDDANRSPTGDSSRPFPASGGGSAGPDSGIKAPAAVTKTAEVEPRPVLTMVQHLCVSAPERAEGRAKVAGGLKGLLPELEESDRERFVNFLVKLSRSARITHRGVAVELASRLLTEAWPWVAVVSERERRGGGQSLASSPSGPGAVEIASPSFGDGGGRAMLGLVVARAGDRAPTVRSKAASTLAEVLSGVQGGERGYTGLALRKAVVELCGWGGAGASGADGGGGQAGPLLEVVHSRVQDEKASVRRNAVPALEALLGFSPAFSGVAVEGVRGGATAEHAAELLLLQERCNDVSLSTRKAAMTALSSLLMTRPGDEYLQSAWVAAVLPLASDPEQSCQNRLVEIVRTVVLDRVVDWHRAEIGLKKAKGGRTTKGRSNPSAISGDNASIALLGGAGVTATSADRVSSVWSLLAKAGQGDAHKCLKKAIATLMLQKDPVYKAGPLLNALRSAAVVALPPKASPAEGEGEVQEEFETDEAGGWDAEDLRLLSLAQDLSRASLTTIRRGTWALLEAFLDRTPSPSGGPAKKDCPDMDPMFVVRCWNRVRGHILREEPQGDNAGGDGELSSHESAEAFESDGRRVLGVLARLAWSVPAEVATPLAESLLEMLLDLVARPETSAALVGALHMLCFAKADTEESGAAMCNAWANHALSAFEGLLDVFVYQGSGALQEHAGARACRFDMARLVERLLFAVGEVVVVGFTGKEEAAGPSEIEVAGGSGAGSVIVRPTASPRLIKLVQVLLPPRLPSSAHGVEEGEPAPATPSAVRALAFVTLGKLCLRDKELAKSSVNILVRELDTAVDPAVRSNALVVLGDLCVRYTAMVDRHVGAMAACLQDSHALVRRHAILLISQLLLQDYVKWRGLLLFRFLATLVDSDASVRNLGAFTLTRPLIAKTPGLFAQNFVETLFVLNDYSEHPCYAAAAAGRADAGGGVTMEGIHLGGAGSEQQRKRMSVYSTMLEHMSDEHKITVTAKLAQEVLSAAIDGGLPLAASSAASNTTPGGNSAAFSSHNKRNSGRAAAGMDARQKASAVVKDALMVMASPGIRVGARRGGADGDFDDGVDDMGSQQSGTVELAAAKSKLLTKVALKHLMETVVPVLTALKHVLERAHSPLLRELMFYFGALFRNHKEDVKAVLQSEAGLVEEIDYDLRRFQKEEQEKREKAKEAAAAVASAAAAAAAAVSTTMGGPMAPPRTPRSRRSMGDGGGGGVASGKRDSFPASSMRGPRTPMAAVIKSARKTPFQNLGECSAVKLKGSAAMVFSPPRARSGGGGGGTGGRGIMSRPKTPLQLRTPREAVAAALGITAMAISPLPMRSMSASSGRTGVPIAGVGGASGGADIELPSPDQSHPAKRRRWSVSVAPPPNVDTPPGVSTTNDGNPGATDEGSDAEVDSDGNAYFRGVAQTLPRSDEESDGEEEFEGIGDGEGRSKDGQKENDPVMGNAPTSGGNSRRGSRADRTDRHVGAGGGKGGKGAATVTEHERRGGKGKGKGKVSVRDAKEAVVKAEKGLRNGPRNVAENEVKGGARNGARSGAKKSGVAVSGSRIKKEADLSEMAPSRKVSSRRSTRTR